MYRNHNVVSVYIYVNLKCLFHMVLLLKHNITNVVDTFFRACFSNFYHDNVTDICSHLCLNQERPNRNLLIICFFLETRYLISITKVSMEFSLHMSGGYIKVKLIAGKWI